MRALLRVAALSVAGVLLLQAPAATPAAAFGDQCYRDIKATGSVQPTMSRARGSAITAWENAAAARYGQRFGNWYYSADRTFDCKWDTSGTRIRCVAIAGPCGRKR